MDLGKAPAGPVTDLGKLESVHGYSSSPRNARLMLSGVSAAGMLSCTGIALYSYADAVMHPTTSDQGTTLRKWLIFIPMCWLMGAGIIFGFTSGWWQARNLSAAARPAEADAHEEAREEGRNT